MMSTVSGCRLGPDAAASATRTASNAPDPVGSVVPSATPRADTSPTSPPAPPAPAPTRPSIERPLLWPFQTVAAATDWQQAHHYTGAQPWHLDAQQTARAFTTGFLGFTGIDQVLTGTVRGDDAKVPVGYTTPAGDTAVAAVIHLIRIGTGPDAPWEVVGTVDSTLTLTTPAYGTTVSSPVEVAGQITGVDENIRIQVRQPSTPTPIGTHCCTPAGGQPGPWSAHVQFTGATAPTLTIIASTGGHLRQVERFAVTGVRTH
jgi:hypothetical protein